MKYQVVKFRDLDASVVNLLGGAKGGSSEFHLHDNYPINIPFNTLLYMKQGKKRKDQPEDDLFEFSESKKEENELSLDVEIQEKDIPQDNLFNKFVNWFRTKS